MVTLPNTPSRHVPCMDMVHVDWEPEAGQSLSESAIMLEIWERGALLQTSLPIPKGSSITIGATRDTIAAEVSACERDNSFGYLIEVNVGAAEKWFPYGYTPAWCRPDPDVAVTAADRVC